LKIGLSKYTKDERQIVRRINYLQQRMAMLRKKYLESDIKVNVLIHSLKGKYKRRSKYKIGGKNGRKKP